MIANYHTHTWRCNHATGDEESYVKAALESGFSILGFSDHAPQCFPDNYHSTIRMELEQLRDYCDTILALRKKYAGNIDIPLGLELEYYPGSLPKLLPILKDHGIEYAILGQHFLGNEAGQPYAGRATEDVSILDGYCRQSMDAMQTGLFTYFAHPDLIRYVGEDRVYRRHMRRLCQEAKSCGLPLEINMLGIWSGRHYPQERFWELAAEEGCSVVIGCDAHAPEHLKRMDAEDKAMEIVNRYGLRLLETVSLRKI
ncbi:MAG: histidinol-phosphatase [Oscillospiraceae bacterium]|nr:histidinol-phosphatase [Oscillospiraceae bacterium]